MSNFEIVRLDEHEVFVLAPMLKDFAAFQGYDQYDEDRVLQVLEFCVLNGVVLAAYDGIKLAGFIAGAVQQPLWTNKKILAETAWWVVEEYRGTSVGLRLLKEFESYGKGLRISLSLLANSPIKESSMNKLGYKQVEKAYLKESA